LIPAIIKSPHLGGIIVFMFLTAIPIGIGIYGIRHGRKAPTVRMQVGPEPAYPKVSAPTANEIRKAAAPSESQLVFSNIQMSWQEEMIGQTGDEAFIKEACQRLTQMGVESIPIVRHSPYYIRGRPRASVINELAINLNNLDAVQFYSQKETHGYYSPSFTTYYYRIDYLLRAGMRRIGREVRRLNAYAEFRWRGPIWKPAQRELQDIRWIAGRWGWIALFRKLFRSRPNSRLSDALNNDIALRDSLVVEFRKPWVARGKGELSISFEGIGIVADKYNNCVRIRTPRETHDKEAHLDVLPSRELMQALDRIAQYVRKEIAQLESDQGSNT